MKEIVYYKKNELEDWIDPDDLLRESILKWLFLGCLFSISVVIIYKIIGIEADKIVGTVTSTFISIFFALINKCLF